MSSIFSFNERLGISLPALNKDWEQYSLEERQRMVYEWEKIRGMIPNQIKRFERELLQKQSELDSEENFKKACSINAEIVDYASRIHDLNLWYRVKQDVESMV